MAIVTFAFFQPWLVKVATWKVWTSNLRSRSRSTTLIVVPFDGKYQPVQRSYLSIFLQHSSFLRYSHFKIHDLENVEQAHDVQHWSHSKQISTSTKVILEYFSSALIVFEIFKFQNSWPQKCRSRTWCTTLAIVPFDGKYLTYNLMPIVMFALSLTISEIFAFQIKCQNFDLEIEGQGAANWDLWHSIGNVWFHRWIFQNFSYLEIYVYSNWSHTHTHTPTQTHTRKHARTHARRHVRTHARTHVHTHTQQETEVMTIGNINKADLSNNGTKYGMWFILLVSFTRVGSQYFFATIRPCQDDFCCGISHIGT